MIPLSIELNIKFRFGEFFNVPAIEMILFLLSTQLSSSSFGLCVLPLSKAYFIYSLLFHSEDSAPYVIVIPRPKFSLPSTLHASKDELDVNIMGLFNPLNSLITRHS